ITDRKKDIIVLSGGENVSPARIEGMLVAQPEIVQAVVVGDGRAGLSALVVPADGCDELAVAVGISRVNMQLSVTERLRRHAVVTPFTVENGLMTPSQKVRRLAVVRAHTDVVERLHG
ncbi:MAG TPA: long-chain fatty acid--CoA ligase, partial [Acetobacteraceae bacterium]|nr:long-chain fatty acid--CoA ligase [Acetobacteraceae bacterium]